MNVVDVEAAARRAVAAIRDGGGPFFLECRTYRFRAHSMFDPQLYREKAEVEEWMERDPIARFRDWAMQAGEVHDDDVAAIEEEVRAEVEAAVAFAEAGTWEPVEDLARDVGAERRA
jgi:TPP-dependent pyruvate/acetoin dehydrogenase alpha subunit